MGHAVDQPHALTFHPAAEIFPLMGGEDYASLVRDIVDHGLREPIVCTRDHRILDGRNRYRACLDAGVSPRFETWDGDDPVAYVVSLNLHRRHLDESQRAMVAARVATLKQGARTDLASIDATSQSQAAELLNVSRPSVQRARQVLDEGVPELVSAVEQGQVSVSLAAKVAQAEPDIQREVVEQVQQGVKPSDAARMAVHYSSESPEHYTPQLIIDATIACLGTIDVDPCSNAKGEAATVPSALHFTSADDGLSQEWHGRIYMNPPYGREIERWVRKLVTEHEAGRVTEAIALLPARPDTQWFDLLRDFAWCAIHGRLTFIGNHDPAPFPSAVFYLGENLGVFYRSFVHLGDIWQRIEPGMFGE